MPYALDEPDYYLLGTAAGSESAGEPCQGLWRMAGVTDSGGRTLMDGSNLLLAGVLFLFAAVVAVPLAARLGIGAVLGYLLAGIAIGPWGLGLSAMWMKFSTSLNWAWSS